MTLTDRPVPLVVWFAAFASPSVAIPALRSERVRAKR